MSDSEEESKLPSREECELRCQQFAEITGTDSALAMFYLQDREWNLDRAVNAFFEEQSGPVNSCGVSVNVMELTRSSPASETTDTGKSELSQSSTEDEVMEEPHRLRVLSWNIDGLDTNNIKNRTKGVCYIINREKPHIVFLQEVVPVSLEVLEKHCTSYQIIPGNESGYFTAVLLRVGDVVFKDSVVIPFLGSLMGRNLLTVKCEVKGVKLCVLTSHLESTKDSSTERKRQLQECFKRVKEADKMDTVIFGGDLNLRDKEIMEIGGLPEHLYDIWEVTGKRPEAKFTWDMRRNDNLEFPGKFKPTCRFDRLYIRHSHPDKYIKPVYFELRKL